MGQTEVSTLTLSSVFPEMGGGFGLISVYNAKGSCVFIQATGVLDRLYKQDCFLFYQCLSCGAWPALISGKGGVVTEHTANHSKSNCFVLFFETDFSL